MYVVNVVELGRRGGRERCRKEYSQTAPVMQMRVDGCGSCGIGEHFEFGAFYRERMNWTPLCPLSCICKKLKVNSAAMFLYVLSVTQMRQGPRNDSSASECPRVIHHNCFYPLVYLLIHSKAKPQYDHITNVTSC